MRPSDLLTVLMDSKSRACRGGRLLEEFLLKLARARTARGSPVFFFSKKLPFPPKVRAGFGCYMTLFKMELQRCCWQSYVPLILYSSVAPIFVSKYIHIHFPLWSSQQFGEVGRRNSFQWHRGRAKGWPGRGRLPVQHIPLHHTVSFRTCSKPVLPAPFRVLFSHYSWGQYAEPRAGPSAWKEALHSPASARKQPRNSVPAPVYSFWEILRLMTKGKADLAVRDLLLFSLLLFLLLLLLGWENKTTTWGPRPLGSSLLGLAFPMKSPEGGSFDFVCVYVPSLLCGAIPGSVLFPGEELEGGGGTGRRKVVSGHGMEASRRKLRKASSCPSFPVSLTSLPSVCPGLWWSPVRRR